MSSHLTSGSIACFSPPFHPKCTRHASSKSWALCGKEIPKQYVFNAVRVQRAQAQAAVLFKRGESLLSIDGVPLTKSKCSLLRL